MGAFIAINITAVSLVVTSVLYKKAEISGVFVLDYQFFRNFILLVLITIGCVVKK